jgi:hypothetical protein
VFDSAWPAQERGAGGVFELADLVVRGGALDADLAGGVAIAATPGSKSASSRRASSSRLS